MSEQQSRIRIVPQTAERRVESAITSMFLGRREQINAQEQPTHSAPVGPAPSVQMIAVDEVGFGQEQVREVFDQEELEGLALSMMAQGVIQPIVVRPTNAGAEKSFEVIAGERRLRAAHIAGLTQIPAIVKSVGDRDALELAIIENAQRENLNPIEEARSFDKLVKTYGLSHGDVAHRVGKSRVAITNSLRLLDLPDEIVQLLFAGDLSAGHGRVLLMVRDAAAQLDLAQRVIRDGLSVRALERLVARWAQHSEESADDDSEDNREQLERIERKLEQLLESKVKLKLTSQGYKKLELTFPSEAAWRRFYAKLR